MPTPAENLTPQAEMPQIKAAISETIAQLMKENPEMKQDQAIATAYSMAEKATGKTFPKPGGGSL